jgi:hypothetical protein
MNWMRGAAAGALGIALSFGVVQLGEPPPAAGIYSLAQEQEPCGFWCGTTQWVGRHPALSGAIAGGLDSSRGVGTFLGGIAGAMIGSTAAQTG